MAPMGMPLTKSPPFCCIATLPARRRRQGLVPRAGEEAQVQGCPGEGAGRRAHRLPDHAVCGGRLLLQPPSVHRAGAGVGGLPHGRAGGGHGGAGGSCAVSRAWCKDWRHTLAVALLHAYLGCCMFARIGLRLNAQLPWLSAAQPSLYISHPSWLRVSGLCGQRAACAGDAGCRLPGGGWLPGGLHCGRGGRAGAGHWQRRAPPCAGEWRGGGSRQAGGAGAVCRLSWALPCSKRCILAQLLVPLTKPCTP